MPRLRSLLSRAALGRLRAYGAVALGASGIAGDRALHGPLYAQISIADPCNHRCVMCPYHPPGQPQRRTLPKFGDALPGIMSLARFDAVTEDLAALGTRRVDLVGRGEPLLNPEAVAMVALARRRGLEVALTTNGSRLDERTARGLVEARLDQLKISLNAGRAATYPKIHVTESEAGFAAVLDGVRRVTRAPAPRPHVTLSFTISAPNHSELTDMVSRAAEVGADAAYFQHLIPVDGRPDLSLDAPTLRRVAQTIVPPALARARASGIETNLRSFADEAIDRADAGSEPPGAVPCYVGHYFTAILGNGHVMPCCQIERPVGSVAETSFKEVWASDAYRELRRAARRLPVRSAALETAECERCYFRPHNLTIHRIVRPWSGAGRGARFSIAQARRLTRLDHDADGEAER